MNKTHENDQFYGSTGSTVPGTWLVPMQWCVHVRQDSGCQGSNNKTAMKRCKGEMVAHGSQLRPPYIPTASKSCSRFVVSGPSKKTIFVCSSIPPSFNIGKSGRGRVWKWAMGELSVACDSMSDGCVFWRNWYCGQKLPFWVFKHWNRITPKFWVAKECSNKLVGTQFLSG